MIGRSAPTESGSSASSFPVNSAHVINRTCSGSLKSSSVENPPFVEALWRRERLLFWGVAIGVGLLSLGLRRVGGALLLHLLLPVVSAFILTGLLSLARLAIASRTAVNPREGWLSGAMWGSAAWWVTTLLLVAALLPFIPSGVEGR